MIVLLPGATRPASLLGAWRSRLPALDVIDIPGQGVRPPLAIQTLEALVDDFSARLEPGSLVVGESVGGLIALGLAHRGYRVVALDPPLTTAKQAAMHAALLNATATLAPAHPYRAFVATVLGLMPDGSVEERDYYPLLEGLPAKVDIVTGDPALCVLDALDRLKLIQSPMVRLHMITGGHALLDTNPNACQEIIEAALADLERT